MKLITLTLEEILFKFVMINKTVIKKSAYFNPYHSKASNEQPTEPPEMPVT